MINGNLGYLTIPGSAAILCPIVEQFGPHFVLIKKDPQSQYIFVENLTDSMNVQVMCDNFHESRKFSKSEISKMIEVDLELEKHYNIVEVQWL